MRKRPNTFGFQEEFDFSAGHAPEPDDTFNFLRHKIPNYHRVRKAATENDRSGCDYYIERRRLPSLGVDLKLRRHDFSIDPPRFADDLALETWSVIESQIPGWTRDPSKACDYILWFWKDTGRFYICPFPPLCSVFMEKWQEWRKLYRTETQRTEGRTSWRSECVFVPRRVVEEAITEWCSGQAQPMPKPMATAGKGAVWNAAANH